MMKNIKRIVNFEEHFSSLLTKSINKFLEKDFKEYEENYLKDNEYIIDIRFERDGRIPDSRSATLYTAFIFIGEEK